MHVVNTGILPVIAGAERMTSGQDAVIETTERLATGAFPSHPCRIRTSSRASCSSRCACFRSGRALLVRDTDPVVSDCARAPTVARAALSFVVVLTVVAVIPRNHSRDIDSGVRGSREQQP